MTSIRQRAGDLHSFRSMMELAICFVITVSMLRGFFLEGYLVSTGSMAPVLLGFHKRVHCPSCEYSFACGVRFDESTETSSTPSDSWATCPNCGQINIDITPVPRNHGDQLLVHKNVFDFRRPRRWEPVVFRNPDNPGEAYVKRVIGLPGEQLLIVEGDIYINGQMARKSLTTQRNMRILVSDLSFVPDNPDWELPWNLEGGWTVDNGRLECDSGDGSQTSTLSFRNWRWFGGQHLVETPLSAEDAYPDWTDFVRRFDRVPVSWSGRLDFDEQAEVLRCRGVMPEEMQQDLMTSATSEGFRRAVYRLAARSHLSPVTDRYGYNSVVASGENNVADLMLEATVQIREQPQGLSVFVPVRSAVYEARIDLQNGQVELWAEGSSEPLRAGQIPVPGETLKIEASGFDQRVLVAVNDELCFPPLDLPATVERPSEDSSDDGAGKSAASTAAQVQHDQEFRLVFRGGHVSVPQLRMYRDVYYTPGRRKHAVESPCRVAADAYFVQGDNSPVSSDSRSWKNPFVPHQLLLGKPFVVHLPSRPGRLKLGSREISIRIPDFSRIRYIQ